MELTIRKDDLLKGLSRCQSVVERRTSMPILSNVLLEANDNKLQLTATDLEISIQAGFACRLSSPGNITVPARKAFEIIKELPSEEVYLKEKENSYLHISGGRASYDLVGLSAEEYPKLPEISDVAQIKLAGEVLREMIEKTIFSISQEETRYNLAGLYVQKRKKDDELYLRFVSTDGHRLSLIDRKVEGLEGLNLEQGVIIPRKGVLELRKVIDEGEDLSLGFNQRQAVLSKDELTMIFRLQEGAFPDYEVVIPKNIKKQTLLSRSAFNNVLKRVSIMADDRHQGIRLDFKSGLLEVASYNSPLGEAKESLEMDYEGDTFGVGFNARYFLDICAAMRSENISLSFVDEQSPCLIKGEGDPGFLSVIMPMRL